MRTVCGTTKRNYRKQWTFMTCNWNWPDVIQGLHNVLFSLFKAKSKFQTEFRRNGKYLRSQSPSFFPVHTSKKSSFPLRSAVTAAKHPTPHSPLKDIPQKTLVRGAVNVRGSLIRAVICHFKRSTLWKLCYQRRLTAVARCCSSWKEFNLTLSNVQSFLPPPARGRGHSFNHFRETRWHHAFHCACVETDWD